MSSAVLTSELSEDLSYSNILCFLELNDQWAETGVYYNQAECCGPSQTGGHQWSLANTVGQRQTETGEPSLALSALENLWQTSEQSKWQWQLCTVGLRMEDLHLNSCSRGWNPLCLDSSAVASHWLYWCALHYCSISFLLPFSFASRVDPNFPAVPPHF